MSLLISIVEREVEHFQGLLVSPASSDSDFSAYLDIAAEMGIYGDSRTRLRVVRHLLQDLYQYFCHLYEVRPQSHLYEPVGVVQHNQRRRFIRRLYTYWQQHLDPILVLVTEEKASDDIHRFFAPEHPPEYTRAIRQRVRDLQILADALDIIAVDPCVNFPQRPKREIASV